MDRLNRLNPSEGGGNGPPTQAMLGIFVGGRGTRMGGSDKWALPGPNGSTILQQQLALGASLQLPCVLVGTPPGPAGPTSTLAAATDAPRIADRPAGIGPLGGLSALLTYVQAPHALALACDMPFVDAAILQRLLTAPAADVVAPRDPESGKWSPLCARYDTAGCRAIVRRAIDDGVRSFQACFARLTVSELVLSAQERARLRDWDRPEDMDGTVALVTAPPGAERP